MPMRVDTFADDLAAVPDEAIGYRRVAWDRIGGRERCPVGWVAKLRPNAFSDYPEDRLACVLAGDLRKLAKGDGKLCPQGLMPAATDDEPWHGVVFDLTIGY